MHCMGIQGTKDDDVATRVGWRQGLEPGSASATPAPPSLSDGRKSAGRSADPESIFFSR